MGRHEANLLMLIFTGAVQNIKTPSTSVTDRLECMDLIRLQPGSLQEEAPSSAGPGYLEEELLYILI